MTKCQNNNNSQQQACVSRATLDGRRQIYIFMRIFSIPFIFFALIFLPPINSRNSDPGSHSKPLSLLPTTVRGLHFYCELSSLVDSRRIAHTHDINRRSQQLILSTTNTTAVRTW